MTNIFLDLQANERFPERGLLANSYAPLEGLPIPYPENPRNSELRNPGIYASAYTLDGEPLVPTINSINILTAPEQFNYDTEPPFSILGLLAVSADGLARGLSDEALAATGPEQAMQDIGSEIASEIAQAVVRIATRALDTEAEQTYQDTTDNYLAGDIGLADFMSNHYNVDEEIAAAQHAWVETQAKIDAERRFTAIIDAEYAREQQQQMVEQLTRNDRAAEAMTATKAKKKKTTTAKDFMLVA